MGYSFTDGEKRTERAIAKRVAALVRFLKGGQTIQSFLAGYAKAGPNNGFPYEESAVEFIQICLRLKKGSRLEWASLLFRMRHHSEEYAALKIISPFANKIFVMMELAFSTLGNKIVISGTDDEVFQVHTLMESGKARFRNIDRTSYYTVTKAKFAPAKDGRDFRDS